MKPQTISRLRQAYLNVDIAVAALSYLGLIILLSKGSVAAILPASLFYFGSLALGFLAGVLALKKHAAKLSTWEGRRTPESIAHNMFYLAVVGALALSFNSAYNVAFAIGFMCWGFLPPFCLGTTAAGLFVTKGYETNPPKVGVTRYEL